MDLGDLEKLAGTPEGGFAANLVVQDFNARILPALGNAATVEAAVAELHKWASGEDGMRKAFAQSFLDKAKSALGGMSPGAAIAKYGKPVQPGHKHAANDGMKARFAAHKQHQHAEAQAAAATDKAHASGAKLAAVAATHGFHLGLKAAAAAKKETLGKGLITAGILMAGGHKLGRVAGAHIGARLAAAGHASAEDKFFHGIAGAVTGARAGAAAGLATGAAVGLSLRARKQRADAAKSRWAKAKGEVAKSAESTSDLEKAGKHPGFAKVQAGIARREGLSHAAAGAILAAASRRAGKTATRLNPRLKRVKGGGR
jgi:hypothetical protein